MSVHIAVSGAGGMIGSCICKYLIQMLPDVEIRAGGRTYSDNMKSLEEQYSQVKYMTVDIEDIHSLEKFIQGQDIFINAAGASAKRGISLAKKVSESCHFIDVGYNEAYEKENGKQNKYFCVYGAGMAPGFLGMFTRSILEMTEKAESYRIWYLVREELSQAAAADLADLFQAKTSPKSDKKDVALPNEKVKPQEIPFFDMPVYPFRYYDEEAKRMDALYGIKQSEIYMLREDGDLYEIASRYAGNAKALEEYFVRTSRLSIQGKEMLARIVAEVRGDATYTIAAQAVSQSELSGCVAAAAACEIISTGEKACICRMAEAAIWKAVIKRMRNTEVFQYYKEYSGGIDTFMEEAGEI